MAIILSAKEISAGYQERVIVKDLSLQVDHGERVLLIGPNGCGKTTLLKTIAGQLDLQHGEIIFNNKDISNIQYHERMQLGLGYLLQSRNIFPNTTVEDNLNLSAGLNGGKYKERLDWVIAVFPNLKSQYKKPAGLLSGGQRQALAIGMAFMRKSKLLLLDEPTGGLSPIAASKILYSIQEIQEKEKFTCIMVEHNLKMASKWATRVVAMKQGRIVADEVDTKVILEYKTLQRYYFK